MEKEIKKEDIKKEDNKLVTFKNEAIEYLKDLYTRSISFMKKNKLELSFLFVVIFLFFVINDKKNYEMCNGSVSKGGAPQQMTPQQIQQLQQQQQQQQQRVKEAANRSKSQLANLGIQKFGSIIMNSSILSSVMCYIASFIKTGFALFSIVFAVMLIPGIPVFGFMLLLFVIMKDKVADMKSM
jgi:hypothetical protein